MTIRSLLQRRRHDRLARPSAMRANAYIAGVIVLGAALVTATLLDQPAISEHRALTIALFTVGVVAGELFPLRVRRPGAEGEITPSTTFAFALVLAAGTLAVPLMAAACLICDRIGGKPAVKALFNSGQYAITVAATAALLAQAGVPHLGEGLPFAPGDLPVILLAGGVFFAVNSLLVATVIALLEQQSLVRCISEDLLFQATSAGLLLGLAPMVVLSAEFSPLLLPLFVLPLLSIVQGQKQALQKEHESIHDALTGLPNRVLFGDRIAAAIRAAAHDAEQVAVMVIDLDGFKEINDTLGHHEGDRLLRALARRLRDGVRAGHDVAARLGGDEFGVLVAGIERDEAETVARKLHATLREPLELDDLELEMGASVGIALYPDHGTTKDDLIRHADVAMYQAKRADLGIDFYDPRERTSVSRDALKADLRRAIDRGELVPYFQPKVHLATGRIVGVETMMRWHHPERGLLLPGEFIALAEQTGTIIRATEHILEAALLAQRRWKADGHDLTVAVNLSPRSLLDRRLPTQIEQMLDRTGTPGTALELEITESMLMADPERASQLLEAVRQLGVSIAIDDFGTGYSSLERLRRLPLDAVKIDRSFVAGMRCDSSDAMIVRSTIDLGQHLGLRVVAEGAEDEATWEELRRMGADEAQGYFVCEPLSPPDFERWLSAAPLLAPRARVASAPAPVRA